jgi:hypothetical protein
MPIKRTITKPKRSVAKSGNTKTITRATRSGGTKIKTVDNDTEMVNIVKKDKAGNVIKDKTRSKVFVRSTDDDDAWGSHGSVAKRGGIVKKTMKKKGIMVTKKK